MRKNKLIIALMFLCLLPKRPEASEVLKLSLKSSILMALKNNLSIQISRLSPQIRKNEVVRADSAFDPLLSFDSSVDNDKQIPTFRFSGTETETTRLNASAKKKFYQGTEISMGMENTRVYTNNQFNTFNPYVRTDLFLRFDQPILRGFGSDINKIPIIIAQNNQRMDEYTFKAKVLETTFNVYNIYWGLVFHIKHLNMEKLLLKRAEELLSDNKEKVRVGVMARIEVLQAEVGVSTRQEEVIKSQHKVREFEDKLREILYISRHSKYWLADIELTDKPVLPSNTPDEKSIIDNAFKNRPELRSKHLLMENLKSQKMLAENATLPSLNLQVRGALHGIGEDFNESVNKLQTGSFHNLNIGVVLTYPLYNRDKKAEALQKGLELTREKTRLSKLKSDIVFEVRNVLRKLATGKKRIEVMKKTVELEKEQLKMEEEKLKVGLSTSHDVLQFQAELAKAQNSYLSAITEYLIGFAELQKIDGTILQKQNISISFED